MLGVRRRYVWIGSALVTRCSVAPDGRVHRGWRTEDLPSAGYQLAQSWTGSRCVPPGPGRLSRLSNTLNSDFNVLLHLQLQSLLAASDDRLHAG